MRSKFSANIIGPIVCLLLLVSAIIFCTVVFYTAGISLSLALFVDILPLLILSWLIFGEFRTKMIVVEFGSDSISIKPYAGFGTAKLFRYDQLDGYSVSILDSINMAYEYLYFMQSGKKVGKISEYYHSNYEEMKAELNTKLKDLGIIEFRYWDEIKESFT